VVSLAAQAQQILHPLYGRDDCLLCHDRAGQIKLAQAKHEDFDERCTLCHKLTP
jgi:hypothetical protein